VPANAEWPAKAYKPAKWPSNGGCCCSHHTSVLL